MEGAWDFRVVVCGTNRQMEQLGRGVRKALRIIFVSPHTIAIRRAMGLCPALRCFGSVLSHAEHPDPPHPPKQT